MLYLTCIFDIPEIFWPSVFYNSLYIHVLECSIPWPNPPILHRFFSNRAACHLKLHNFIKCVEDCSKVSKVFNITVQDAILSWLPRARASQIWASEGKVSRVWFFFFFFFLSQPYSIHWFSTIYGPQGTQIPPPPSGKRFRSWPVYPRYSYSGWKDNAPAHKSLVGMAAVRDWFWSGWSPSIFWFGTILLFSVPQHGKTLGWEAVGHICSWGHFWGSGWELLYHGNPSAATPIEEVCGPQGRIWWKTNHIWSNSTIAS